MTPVRMGFVGAGYMGQLAHIANYAALETCEMIALAEPRARTRSGASTPTTESLRPTRRLRPSRRSCRSSS
ncbi:MAG: hypothetical protein ACOX9R_09635 [Armatimonadota bacterium]|jgi:predicted dehydrogenase